MVFLIVRYIGRRVLGSRAAKTVTDCRPAELLHSKKFRGVERGDAEALRRAEDSMERGNRVGGNLLHHLREVHQNVRDVLQAEMERSAWIPGRDLACLCFEISDLKNADSHADSVRVSPKGPTKQSDC